MADGPIKGKVVGVIRSRREGGFDRYAALEAIDCAIRDATAADTALARHIGWLQDVKRRRKQEIAAGTWPPKGGEDR